MAVILCLFMFSGCVVSRQRYEQLQGELDSSVSQNRLLADELGRTQTELNRLNAERQAVVSEQKNRIAALEREIEEVKADHARQVAAGRRRQKELALSIASLRERSTEETQNLLQQLIGLQEACEQDIREREQVISQLKTTQRQEVEGLQNRLDHETQANRLVVTKLEEKLARLESRVEERQEMIGRLARQTDRLEELLQTEIQAGTIIVRRQPERTVINVADRILFDSGQAQLKGEVADTLEKIGGALVQFTDSDIRIEGHTDDVPIRTSQYPSNWELSAARALAVLRFVLEHTALEPRRFAAVACGAQKPLAPNDSPENRSLNRRVDIVIVPQAWNAF
jgi:chemotaxis protein MotB